MAQINIVQPALGKLEVVSSSEASYTVRFVPPEDQQYTRGNIRLYCEACGRTLIESSSNPAVFNISNLEASGHPGPFDISVDVTGQVTVYVNTYAMDAQGTTDPVTAQYGTVLGGSVDIRLRATPNEGYEFDHWDRLNSTWTSTTQNLNLRVSNVQKDEWRVYQAYFRKKTEKKNKFYVLCQYMLAETDELVIPSEETFDRSEGNPRSLKAIQGYEFAKIYGNAKSYTNGSISTFRVELTAEALSHGIKFVRWGLPSGGTILSFSVDNDGLELSLKFNGLYSSMDEDFYVRAYFTRAEIKSLTVHADSDLYGTVSVSGAASFIPARYPDGSDSGISAAYWDNSRARIAKFVFAVPPEGKQDATTTIGLRLWKNMPNPPVDYMTEFANMAFIHGYTIIGSSAGISHAIPGSGRLDISINIRMLQATDIYVAMCTHMLVYDSGRNLVSRSNSLVCDCHKPSGGTFIEL